MKKFHNNVSNILYIYNLIRAREVLAANTFHDFRFRFARPIDRKCRLSLV